MQRRKEVKSVTASARQMASGRHVEELVGPMLEDGWTIEDSLDKPDGGRLYVLTRVSEVDDVAEGLQAYLRDRDAAYRRQKAEEDAWRQLEAERAERANVRFAALSADEQEQLLAQAAANVDPLLRERIPAAVTAELHRLVLGE